MCSKPLVGILLSVFVKKEHFSHVKDVMLDSAGVGVMGVGGNKGGVAIRFGLYDSTVCIVNAHLAAHKNNVQVSRCQTCITGPSVLFVRFWIDGVSIMITTIAIAIAIPISFGVVFFREGMQTFVMFLNDYGSQCPLIEDNTRGALVFTVTSMKSFEGLHDIGHGLGNMPLSSIFSVFCLGWFILFLN